MNEFQNLFDEDTLRKNIEFAALFVLNYECLKEYVVSQVREFYSDSISFVQGEMIFKESENYKKNVRSLANKIDTASIMWFVNAGAITEQELDLYHTCRKRRNDITQMRAISARVIGRSKSSNSPGARMPLASQ